MSVKTIHQCQCEICQSSGDKRTQALHHQMNVVMSRLDEQQRRWYAAVEANRNGHGGLKLVHQITGLAKKTIQRGQREMKAELAGCPDERIRVAGGGRPTVEKKRRPSSKQLRQ
ncbi:MAG: transposase [Anaerolineae bacterium]|nr:transposase [Anaerolineae bacterium]